MLALAGLALVCLTTAVPAQGGRGNRAAPGGRCVLPDTTGAWYRKQREWMNESGQKWSNDSLRALLVAAAERMEAALPESGRVTVTGFTPVHGWSMADVVISSTPADSMAVAAVRSMGRGAQPAKSAIGAAGVRAVWLITQRDTALERGMIHRLMEAGPEEAMPSFVAIMEDRVRTRTGRPQLYGTLLHSSGGTLAPLPIEDSAHVDLRREGAWLPPIAQAVCAARSAAR
jgi:hypothetical protein